MRRNPALAHFRGPLIFDEVQRRRDALIADNPKAHVISLGIGDTSEPVPSHVVKALKSASAGLGTFESYTGYQIGSGHLPLREAIAHVFYGGRFTTEEITISDGASGDISRAQLLFPEGSRIGVQALTYPGFFAASALFGRAGQGYRNIVSLSDLSDLPTLDLLYLCSPNNPTGEVLTREQLAGVIAQARRNRTLILFDAAYNAYIRDPKLPRSIFEVEGAEEVAIEFGSFSKLIGFTGVRLGWAIVPKALSFDGGRPLLADWKTICHATYFGASSIAQKGGVAALDPTGLAEMARLTDFYLENVSILRAACEERGLCCCGGLHAPYVWVDFKAKDSWAVFDHLLKEAHLVTMPGTAFGPAGEGHIRLSGFRSREEIEEAASRLREVSLPALGELG